MVSPWRGSGDLTREHLRPPQAFARCIISWQSHHPASSLSGSPAEWGFGGRASQQRRGTPPGTSVSPPGLVHCLSLRAGAMKMSGSCGRKAAQLLTLPAPHPPSSYPGGWRKATYGPSRRKRSLRPHPGRLWERITILSPCVHTAPGLDYLCISYFNYTSVSS